MFPDYLKTKNVSDLAVDYLQNLFETFKSQREDKQKSKVSG